MSEVAITNQVQDFKRYYPPLPNQNRSGYPSIHLPPQKIYKKCNLLSSFFIFKIFIEFACFICVCILVKTCKNNPFKNHIIGDLNLYFKGGSNTYNKFLIKKNTKEDHIFNEGKNISSESDDIKRKLLLRKLVSTSFCLEIFGDFKIFKGKNLENIFNLNYNKIFVYSLVTLLFSCLLIVIFFIGVYITKNFTCCNCCADVNPEPVCCSYCNIIFYIVFLILYGTRFIMSLILFYYMEKGDIEKYDDFLDCPSVKVDYFKKKISSVNKLRGCFYAFVIMNFILLGIEKIESYIEYAEKSME